MTKETSYELILDKEIQLRIHFTRERDKITSFIVQLEYFIRDRWYPVIR